MKRDTVPVQPETRYARSGEVNVAYQVLGEGSIDLVYVDVISTSNSSGKSHLMRPF